MTTAAAPNYPLRVYNTLSKNKELFETIEPGRVGMYLCGPTVYKPSHIGHMVGPIIFDSIKRYLTYCGYRVTWVVNITDVDDKLIVRAGERKMTVAALAEEMTADYMRNLAAMGIDGIDHFPRATDYIDGMIEFTERLIQGGYAYEADGDVFFDVTKDREYGKLSGRSLDAMQGEGGGAAGRKKSSVDFALWKGAKPGEPSWPSPWGAGRPGWHIECSVMSSKLLGETFDIHGGGLDLLFPHHENEIAQSECCHKKPFARYWMHNGLMQASGDTDKVGGGGRDRLAKAGDLASQEQAKISGSKGAQPFAELVAKYAPETIRFFILSSHYRRPIDFSEERIDEVEKGLEAFYRFFDRFKRVTGDDFYASPIPARRDAGEFTPVGEVETQIHEHRRKFLEAMDDDFNTGGGIGDLFELVRLLNRFVDAEKLETSGKSDAAKVATLRRGAAVLREIASTVGLFRAPVVNPGAAAGPGDELVGKLMQLFIDVRAEARKAKNFAVADGIRKGLAAIGVVLEDRPDGTSWSVQK